MGSPETVAPAAPPPERPAVARANAKESPPGLDRFRRFLSTPVIRGTLLWVRTIGEWLGAAWRWSRKNAGPILRGLARAAATGAEVARRTAEAGRIATEGGKRLGTWARRRREEGARGRIQDALEDAEEGARTWGPRLHRGGADASGVLDAVSRFAGALAGGRGKHPRRSLPASAGEEPATAPAPPELPETRVRPQPAEPPAPALVAEEPSPEPASESPAETTDERFRDLLARAQKLGRRRRRGPLRKLIVEMVAIRKKATAGELAGWLGMQKKHLKKSHLRPMVEAGELRLLHPEEPTHPDQAYLVGGGGLPSSGELG